MGATFYRPHGLFPAERQKERSMERDDLQHAVTPIGDIAYAERGRGPAALFVHGVFLNHGLWRHVVDRVADMRRCLAVDLLGHGATRTPADADVSVTGQAEMLEAFCQRLGLDQVDVVGNDSGSAIVQIFAARHPERIRSLTLTNGDVHTNFPPDAVKPLIDAAAQGLLPGIGRRMLDDIEDARAQFAVGYEHPELVSEETLRGYLEPLFATPEATRHLERFILALDPSHTVSVEPLLRRLQAPTLVVWGTGDVFFDVEWAYWLRDTIPGTRKVVELDGAKLFFPEERPEPLAVALREHWQPADHAAAGAQAF
jgi:pimeloyl-ACP methyl ester carboxylesterase